MIIAEPPTMEPQGLDASTTINLACSRIPPLFDLENFVAVNPFLGWSGTSIDQAAVKIQAGLGSDIFPAIEYFRNLLQQGKLTLLEIEEAATRHEMRSSDLMAALQDIPEGTHGESEAKLAAPSSRILSRFVSRTLSDLFLPALNNPEVQITPCQIYIELRECALLDQSFSIAACQELLEGIRSMPSMYHEALDQAMALVRENPTYTEDYLYRLLASHYGWASYIRGYGWKTDPQDFALLEALLVALIFFNQRIDESLKLAIVMSPHEAGVRKCLLEASEDHLLKEQCRAIFEREESVPNHRPDFQLLFCIDVRSEVIRRKLELLSARIETVGFAGFFGISVALKNESRVSDRCPILLRPNVEIESYRLGITAAAQPSLQVAMASPGAFSMVEAIGLGYVGKLIARAAKWCKPGCSDESGLAIARFHHNRLGLTLAEQVAIAEGILKNSGIGVRLGQVVVLCGHGSRSNNNAHKASLDCGACGGHCGTLNAQIAVEILNDCDVRVELAKRGYKAIEDTLFVAAWHETSTDRVELFSNNSYAPNQQRLIQELNSMLAIACGASRAERAKSMGISTSFNSDLEAHFLARSNDWSEVRPEWGLARNFSFIAASRSRTRTVNLEGRTFLHDYSSPLDSDDSVLKLILSAPVVVASWINLQYFASTVDNRRLGCGTKALLNRIGNLGVIRGNEGDLLPGLPAESVFCPDGSWYHEPKRLQVLIEAPTEKIDRVLRQIPDVENLFRNGWMRLIALDIQERVAWLRRRDGDWEQLHI